MPGKRSKKRSSKNFVSLPFSGTVALLTLGNVTVKIASLLGANLNEDLYVISTDMSAEINGLTPGEGEPSFIGFAHGDYSETEIKEHLEVKLLGPGNKLEQEKSRRLIRKAGAFYGDGLNTQTNMKLEGRLGSAQIRTRIKFVVESGKPFNVYLYNASGAALQTGSVLRFHGTIYGRWIL